jgi:hypothetical protein
MAVSFKGHNEEAAGRPVDKNNLVDMVENHSKTGKKNTTSNCARKSIAWVNSTRR